jgi:peptidoglycan-N-acetylglucosamine deacetylase
MIKTKMGYLFFLVVSIIFTLVLLVLFFQPRFILRKLTQRNPEVIFFVETKEKVLALTIDDGPCISTTNQLLDLLDKYKVKATFFLISENLLGNEDVVRRMITDGHEIGNHNTKDEPSCKLPLCEFDKQVKEAHRALSTFGEIKYYRPGSGWYNQAMIDSIKKLDYLCILASVHPFDSQIASASFGKIQIMLNSSPGSIILLHDCFDRGNRTINILDYIIPRLLEKGYSFVTISDLLARNTSASPRLAWSGERPER